MKFFIKENIDELINLIRYYSNFTWKPLMVAVVIYVVEKENQYTSAFGWCTFVLLLIWLIPDIYGMLKNIIWCKQ